MTKERPILFSAPMVRAVIGGKKTQTRRLVKDCKQFKEWEATPSDAYRVIVADDASAAAFLVAGDHGYTDWVECPYGKRGDRLWVKETHAYFSIDAYKYLDGPLASLELRAYGGAPLTPGCNLRWHTGDAMVHYAAHPTSPDELRASPGFSTWRSNTPDRWRPSIFMPRWASRITLDIVSVRVERLHDISEADILAEGCSVDVVAKATGIPWSDLPTLHHAWQAIWEHINGVESWAANPWVWVVEFKRAEAEARAA